MTQIIGMRSPSVSTTALATNRLRQIVDINHKDVALLLEVLARRDAEIERLKTTTTV